MSALATITRGRTARPHFVLLHGVDGVGKSTFGAQAPAPIFLGTEATHTLDVDRFPAPATLADFFAQFRALVAEPHEYRTIVIDSADWLEPLITTEVCAEHKVRSIEDLPYGRGWAFALERWRKLVAGIEKARERGLNVVLIAHSVIKRFSDPESAGEYDRFELKLNAKAAALLREAADTVAFMSWETNIVRERSGKTRATGDGSRVIYLERRPGFDAKNRVGLPPSLDVPTGANNWQTFADAYAAAIVKVSHTAPPK